MACRLRKLLTDTLGDLLRMSGAYRLLAMQSQLLLSVESQVGRRYRGAGGSCGSEQLTSIA